MRKIYITGHTSGLGAALYDFFDREDCVLIGMSRSNGYDLDKNLIDFVHDDFSIYINNAHSGYQQTRLLYQLFEKNQGRRCVIVNIGSVSADGNKDSLNEYAVQKAALEKACTQLQLIDTDCRIVHIKLGRMNTPMTEHRAMYPRMHPAYVARSIGWVLSQPNEILVKNLTLDVMHSRQMLNN